MEVKGKEKEGTPSLIVESVAQVVIFFFASCKLPH